MREPAPENGTNPDAGSGDAAQVDDISFSDNRLMIAVTKESESERL
ncbi:hypothetical protein VQ056_21560 [Paenibacillus sp. JTLBN-2024]